jgi:glycine cleavage system H protein
MKFSETHEWIHLDNDVGTVGISNHAQKELGDIVFVELPKIGKNVKAGEEVAVLESTKAAADVYCPVSGTILEVNTNLSNASELVNQSPEKEGWLFKIKLSNPEELKELMEEEIYLSKFS